MSVSSALASEASMHAAFAYNLEMAKHTQDLRDRFNNLYWITWAALLAYLGAANPRPEIVGSACVFLLIASITVLLSSLRWTAEYANHTAAVGSVALALHLNSERPGPTTFVRRFLLIGAFRPFVEFRGFVALPLRVPIWLHAGVLTCAFQSLGAAVAAYGVITNARVLNLAGLEFINPVWSPYAVGAGVAVFAACTFVSLAALLFTVAAIAERLPESRSASPSAPAIDPAGRGGAMDGQRQPEEARGDDMARLRGPESSSPVNRPPRRPPGT